MNITRIGIDLAKQVFQVHGVDHFEQVERKQLRSVYVGVRRLTANLPATHIGVW